MYDEELDDYVDLEEGSDVPNKAKIKLVRKQGLRVDVSTVAGWQYLICFLQF